MSEPAPQIRWVLVDPRGNMILDRRLCVRRRSAIAGAADDMKQWRELEASGWRVAQVTIALIPNDTTPHEGKK